MLSDPLRSLQPDDMATAAINDRLNTIRVSLPPKCSISTRCGVGLVRSLLNYYSDPQPGDRSVEMHGRFYRYSL